MDTTKTYGGYQKLPIYDRESEFSADDIVSIPLREVISTDESPFLYAGHVSFGKTEDPKRFVHEKAKAKARFTDGNNGDYWRVIASASEYKRILVQNLTQDFVVLMYWE
jgi:hypothetical protein